MKKRYILNKNGTATAKYGPGSKTLKEPSLFDDEEGTFIDNNQRKRIVVHLVPAPWSRVLVYSIIYALAVAAVQEVWFWNFGKPDLKPAYQAVKHQAIDELKGERLLNI